MTPLLWLLPLFFVVVLVSVMAAGAIVMRLQERAAWVNGNGAGAVAPDPSSGFGWAIDALAALGKLLPANQSAGQDGKLLRLLFRAGHRSPSAPFVLHGVQIVAGLLLAVILGVSTLATRSLPDAFIPAICGAGFGFLLPPRILEWVVRFRVRRIRAALPPALDLLVLALEAGQPLEQAMEETSKAIRTVYPELASEFVYCSLEINAGTARGNALHRLGERGGDEELRKVAAVLIDGERFGTPLGPALRSHSHYLRSRMRQGAQEAARKLTVKLVIPVFFLIFPSVLLVTLGPAYFQMRSFLDNFLK
ncbi:MAG: type II secretion system F family protein [Bryobacteraceae bacterium]